MTEREFSQWLAYHLSAFRGLAGYFGHMSPAERSATQAHWFGVLAAAELVDATAATDEMFRDETGRYAKLFDETPATVRRLSRGQQQQRERAERIKALPTIPDDEERRYRCRHCLDSTWVTIWSPGGVRRIAEVAVDGHLPANWWSLLGARPTFAVSCSCKGQEFADRRVRSGQGVMFNEWRHCPVDRTRPEKMLEWYAARPTEAVEWEF